MVRCIRVHLRSQGSVYLGGFVTVGGFGQNGGGGVYYNYYYNNKKHTHTHTHTQTSSSHITDSVCIVA